MSASEGKKQYVVKCERLTDRVGLTFQFTHSGRVTWWQRRQDFEENDGEAGTWWLEAAATSYEQCAARLTGPAGAVAANAVPNISMGDLHIETNPTNGMARIEIAYHNYGGRKATEEAHYSYELPIALVAAAFTEAAATIRATGM